jgi:Protein of unknown function (DUF3313).
MFTSRMRRSLLPAALCAAVAGCSTPEPVAYRGIASAPYLKPDSKDRRIPYLYETKVDWRQYTRTIVDHVEIYQGTDHQFGDMSPQDRATLARYMYARFSEELARRFQLTSAPGSDTLRIKLTLAGAATTTPVLGPLSRFDIAGGLYNGVQSFRGGEGTMTGSVLYAVEVRDSTTNQLLLSYISKQYPNSMNIGAAFGSLAAAKTGIDKGAEALLEQLY